MIITRQPDPQIVQQLIRQGLNEFEAKIYAARGICQRAELETELAHLLPFHSLKNSDLAANRLYQAILQQERILIIGDYDADGATACAVGVKGLKLLGAQVDFLVPNRFEDGYGLTPEIVVEAAKRQPQIIVTVDNGIASCAGVAQAKACNIEVIITDHHLPGEHLPEAIIVNPNQPGCPFPSKNLAGVGVIFYVLLALRATMRAAGHFTDRPEPKLAELLDLVALGTVADVVKLDQNNRILVAQGLKRIRSGKGNVGMTALFQLTGRDITRASAFDFGFILGPRINAAGRLQDMSIGVTCLLAESSQAAQSIAQQLDQLNRERQQIEGSIKEAAQTILTNVKIDTQYSVSLFQADWHQGVIGIVASRIKEQYHRPCFVFAKGKADELKGSGRSIPGVHLRDMLDLMDKRAPGLLQRFGGHAMAAGVTILQQDFERFATLFEQLCCTTVDDSTWQKQIYIDGIPPKSAYTLPQIAKLNEQIWGQGFQMPLFMDQFEVVNQSIVADKHLKLQLKNGHGQLLDAMYFQHHQLLPPIFSGVFRLEINYFQQRQKIQLIFQQIK